MQDRYICFWYDGEDYRLTRCFVSVETGKPMDMPETGECLLLIEYEEEHEPIFFDENASREMGVENMFP